MKDIDDHLNASWWASRIGLGFGPIRYRQILQQTSRLGMYYDLAMRDVEIAIGAFALSQITTFREAKILPAAKGTATV